MSKQKSGRIALLDEFLEFPDTTDKVKVLRLRRRILRFLKNSDGDKTQLLDVVRVLDLWVEEHEFNDFNYSFRIAVPVIERLTYLNKFDFYDVAIALNVVGYGKDYKTTYEFSKKILENAEQFKSEERYLGTNITTRMNVMFRLLRARYFEMDYTIPVNELGEIADMFLGYADDVLEICATHPTLWEYKVITQIRKALFEKNYPEIDAGLSLVSEQGSYTMYKVVAEEVNGFSIFAGVDKTKMQLNIQVGKNIRKIRKSKYLRIEDCAKMLYMTPSVLQSIEQGKRSAHIHNLYKLSETFDLSLDEIVKGTTEPSRKNKDNELSKEVQKLVDICKSLEKSDISALDTLAKQLAKKN